MHAHCLRILLLVACSGACMQWSDMIIYKNGFWVYEIWWKKAYIFPHHRPLHISNYTFWRDEYFNGAKHSYVAAQVLVHCVWDRMKKLYSPYLSQSTGTCTACRNSTSMHAASCSIVIFDKSRKKKSVSMLWTLYIRSWPRGMMSQTKHVISDRYYTFYIKHYQVW